MVTPAKTSPVKPIHSTRGRSKKAEETVQETLVKPGMCKTVYLLKPFKCMITE